MTETRREFYLRIIAEQKQWIQSCGGDLDGYIRNYGAADSPNRVGNGGGAIYKADTDALKNFERRLKQLGPLDPNAPSPELAGALADLYSEPIKDAFGEEHRPSTTVLNDIPDAVLANLLRSGTYARDARFGDGASDAKFLLVLAVPYGPEDQVETLTEAFESFRELLAADDWGARNIQFLTAENGQVSVNETTMDALLLEHHLNRFGRAE